MRSPKALPGTPPPLQPLPFAVHPNPADAYIGRLVSRRSKRTQTSALRSLARILTGQEDPARVPWGDCNERITGHLRSWLASAYEWSTVNRYLAALRGTLRSTWKAKQMSREDYEAAADLPAFQIGAHNAGRILAPEELSALFLACQADRHPIGARDAALVALLYGAGLRIGEAVGAHVEDLGADWMKVREAKGGVPRIAFLGPGTLAALGDWLRLRGREPGPLLTATDRQHKPTLAPITTQAASNAIRKRGDLAGLDAFTPHDLRRTAITAILDQGVDYGTAAKFAGHRSVAVTTLYDRRGDRIQRAAVALLPVPYLTRITDEARPKLPDL